jgi:hypothetical protein
LDDVTADDVGGQPSVLVLRIVFDNAVDGSGESGKSGLRDFRVPASVGVLPLSGVFVQLWLGHKWSLSEASQHFA